MIHYILHITQHLYDIRPYIVYHIISTGYNIHPALVVLAATYTSAKVSKACHDMMVSVHVCRACWTPYWR